MLVWDDELHHHRFPWINVYRECALVHYVTCTPNILNVYLRPFYLFKAFKPFGLVHQSSGCISLVLSCPQTWCENYVTYSHHTRAYRFAT